MKFNNMFKKKEYFLFLYLSVVFVVANILIFDHCLPWNDEVELTETVLNYIDYGQWISKAYPEYGGCTPFSMYVPLPQFLQTAWMFVFGTSMYAARSFNLLIVFFIGLSSIYLIERVQKKPLSIMGTVVLSVLLWGCGEFAGIYRNGRGDIVGVLVCILLFIYAYDYICRKQQHSLRMSAFLSAVLTWCALQACVLVVFTWLYFFFCYQERKKEFVKLGTKIFFGFVIGFLLVVGYFTVNHHFMAFVHGILALSSTLKALAVKALPLVGPMLGLDPAEWAAKAADDISSSDSGLIGKIIGITKFVSYDILWGVCVFLLFLNKKKDSLSLKGNVAFLLVVFSMFVPIIMNLAGRYQHYYWWMSYVPLLFAAILLFERYDSKIYKSIFCICSFTLFCLGISKNVDFQTKEKYDEWRALYSRLPIEKQDVLSVPDLTLYEIRQKSDNCYFTKHYELKNMNLDEVNYYFRYGPDITKNGNTKKSRQFDDAIMNDNSINLVQIERSDLLDLTVYKVEHIK